MQRFLDCYVGEKVKACTTTKHHRKLPKASTCEESADKTNGHGSAWALNYKQIDSTVSGRCVHSLPSHSDRHGASWLRNRVNVKMGRKKKKHIGYHRAFRRTHAAGDGEKKSSDEIRRTYWAVFDQYRRLKKKKTNAVLNARDLRLE